MTENCKKTSGFELSKSEFEAFKTKIQKEPATQIAHNACWKNDVNEICLKRDVAGTNLHVYSQKVESEGKPVTHQRSSGRCWIFAALNVMRLPFMKSLNIDEFEFSQSYLFFCDKIERCNHFLNSVVECIRSGEKVEDRLLSFLLSDPTCDGGQWDMIVNLILKYGLVPKKCFPESYHSESSNRLNSILKSKLREYTSELYAMLQDKDTTPENVNSLVRRQMEEVFRIVSIILGVPPATFTWQYYEKNKSAKSIGPISPLEFYEKHVQPVYDIKNKICLVNDPRPNNPYGKLYSVKYLGNMVNGRATVYNNQPIDMLMKVSCGSIKANEAVWFGCEVSKCFSAKYGIQDTNIFDYKSVLGVDVYSGLSKADRLVYGDSLMTHAMTFTACHLDESSGDLPAKWRVENSWGDDRGDKGYHILTQDWFREYVFEVVVDKAHVPQEVLDVCDNNENVTELPAWDPMGALARNRITEEL